MFEHTFYLDQVQNPILRPGLLGLAEFVRCVRHPRYRHQYPDMPEESEIQFELTETTLRVMFPGSSTVGETNAVLNRMMYASRGDYRFGVGMVPGILFDPDDPSIYALATHHQFVSKVFKAEASATSSRVCMSVNPTYLKKLKKRSDAVPKTILQKDKTPLGCLHRGVWAKGSPVLGPSGEQATKKLVIEASVYSRYKCLNDGSLVPTLEHLKIESKKGASHPLTQGWQNKPPKWGIGLERSMTSLLLFMAPYGYLVSGGNGKISSKNADHHCLWFSNLVGLSPYVTTFGEFNRLFKRHVGFQKGKGYKHVLLHHADPELTARLMAEQLGCPYGRSHHVIAEGESHSIAFSLTHEEALHPVLHAISTIAPSALDVRGKVYQLVGVPLKKGTLYDLALANVKYRRPWYAGFLTKIVPSHLNIRQGKIIKEFAVAMEKNEFFEEYLLPYMRRVKTGIAMRGDTPRWKDATAEVGRILFNVQTRDQLRRAFFLMQKRSGHGPDLRIIMEAEERDPREFTSLLMVALVAFWKKAEKTSDEIGEETDDSETPTDDDILNQADFS